MKATDRMKRINHRGHRERIRRDNGIKADERLKRRGERQFKVQSLKLKVEEDNSNGKG